MDTTPEYIKMCEQAKEIQGAWPLEDGDFYYDPELVSPQVYCHERRLGEEK